MRVVVCTKSLKIHYLWPCYIHCIGVSSIIGAGLSILFPIKSQCSQTQIHRKYVDTSTFPDIKVKQININKLHMKLLDSDTLMKRYGETNPKFTIHYVYPMEFYRNVHNARVQ